MHGNGRRLAGALLNGGLHGRPARARINPRLYFHDAVLKTGKTYVGYIGRYRTNRLS